MEPRKNNGVFVERLTRRLSMASRRKVRRTAGLISSYFSDLLLGFAEKADGRSKQGRRWESPIPLFKAALLGIAAGCKGPTQVEELTKDMFKPVRKLVGIAKRVPDTTLRDFLCKAIPEKLCELLYIVGYDAWRRKALHKLEGFPFHAISMDGKYPSVSDTGDYENLQVHHDEEGNASHGLVRTVTSTLVTAIGRPIIGAVPIPGHTNEQGSFKKALGDLVRIYGRLFLMVMYDAGATSLGNANAVIKAGKHYFFQVADPRWVMYQMIELLLKGKVPVVREEEVISECKRVVRELTIMPVIKIEKNLTIWEHAKTIFKVYSETYEDGVLKGTNVRYFISSMDCSRLSAEQWLRLIVLRWGVETSHQILDLRNAFDEDNHPWIHADARGTLVVQLLRRVVYTLMTLYKSVTIRDEDDSQACWRRHMEWVKDTLKWPNPEEMKGLRVRFYAVPPALI
jgi:hypothetical protein